MNPDTNYSNYTFFDIGIAQQNISTIQYMSIQNCTNISDIIKLYQEYWYLIIDDYDIVIISCIIIEIMIILIIKDLYRRHAS